MCFAAWSAARGGAVGGARGGAVGGAKGRARAPQEDCPLAAAIAPPAPPAILCPAQVERRPEMGEGGPSGGTDPGTGGGGRGRGRRPVGRGGGGRRAERRARRWRAGSRSRPAPPP